ncbi:CRISPR-associated protein DevR [Fervidicella metallireducens AeB]|uniref:CRISPR-associated protein DevR n=1 Tax=Fervidicella metallireducens AeB TaxID=1403537 RepID=A0A017RXH1_9CLOT|nr:DevR family CRISPR-associated autoregulator [Fervidicella metallireducens]EYE89392.1 CRISPR-associated protein DevR [Fervidicella metallireducens AeB]
MVQKTIASISINGELGLNLHSLNNEGGEGNQTLTRQVTIVDENGKIYTVNAVSGDMVKHIQARHLYNIAKEKGLPLCEKCKVFNANRISGDDEFTKITIDKKNEEILDMLIEKCIIDDMEGILITNNNKNLPRKSCAEFGWLVGLPNKVKTETYFHVKLVPNAGEQIGDESSNQGQNVIYRPANSGIYALVSNFDIYRIGYNEITREYPIGDEERKNRYKAFMESLLYTFVKPEGALRNTQNPHITSFKGIISISTSTVPAPTISPINSNYIEQITEVAENINLINKEIIEIKQFNNMSEFTQIMAELINNYEPYKLK